MSIVAYSGARPSSLVRFGSRALFDQELREIVMAVDDRRHQRSRLVACIGLIDVGPGFDKRAGGLEMPFARSEMQRRPSAQRRRATPSVGPRLVRRDRSVFGAGGGAAFGLPPTRTRRGGAITVEVSLRCCSTRDQERHDGRAICRRGKHQRV